MEPSVPDTSQPSSYDHSSGNKWLNSTELDFCVGLNSQAVGEATICDGSEQPC